MISNNRSSTVVLWDWILLLVTTLAFVIIIMFYKGRDINKKVGWFLILLFLGYLLYIAS